MNAYLRMLLITALSLGLGDRAIAEEGTVTAEGITAYFGVVPAALARDAANMHGRVERDAHGLPVVSVDDHHVVVALFDAASGDRITQATVMATKRSSGGSVQRKALEPMEIAGTVTFGNFFGLDPKQTHEFSVEVNLPPREAPIQMSFRYGPVGGNAR